ncbi:MAG: hypothetical protein E7255_15030 [Lachnospiraceae bacterium]|nr:hypothetical protein [Lachnospiraceae bacterium]
MKKKRLLFSLLISSIAITAIFFTKEIYNVQAANYIRFNDTKVELEIGHYKTLRISGTTKKASWSSSNPKVATVSSGGKVTANASGNTTITANVAGKKLTCKVSVYQIYKKELTLAPGNTYTPTIWGPVREVKWSSDNKSVATVSSKGVITAKASGKATITAVVNGTKELTSKVTVVGISQESVVLEVGDWYGHLKTLKVEGTNSKITWTTSDKSVAVVSSKGRVEAKGPGTATITASVGDAKLTCKVKVLKVNAKEFTLAKGETKELKIYGTTSDITWHSNHESVATVSDNGTVKAVSKGDAIIMIYVDGRRVNARVTVK